MAAESRTVDLALAERDLQRRLADEPFVFQFFQAVRLLEKLSPGRVPVGKFVSPSTEVVRFSAFPSTCFPASEIQQILPGDGTRPPRMVVNFMGLTGPLGLLPLYYTHLVIGRSRVRDTALQDFFDIFNHRAISLFYQAWEKYRITIEYERGRRERFSRYLLDLMGLGTRGLQGRQAVPDDSLMFYAGLFSQHPRSATTLRQILEDYFEVPVVIEQFTGAWFRLDRPSQCWLEENRTASERLGFGVVVGDEVWDEQSRVRICLGPLSLPRYLEFLPTGSASRALRAITKFFSGNEVDFEVQLVLKREETPGCELGAEGDAAPQLGWVSWAKTAPLGRDPSDAVLQL
jgi:type VI secretion system protein ImpH